MKAWEPPKLMTTDEENYFTRPQIDTPTPDHLAALEAAQKERDGAQTLKVDTEAVLQSWKYRAEHAEAYTAKLEKAGEDLADYHRPIITSKYWRDALDAWDVVRKEKPNV